MHGSLLIQSHNTFLFLAKPIVIVIVQTDGPGIRKKEYILKSNLGLDLPAKPIWYECMQDVKNGNATFLTLASCWVETSEDMEDDSKGQ